MKTIAASDLRQSVGRVVDVRTEMEFAAERLPGAESVPLDRLCAAASGWSRSEPLVILCASGVRASDAAGRLASMGFTDIGIVQGGLKACKAAGLNVVVERKTIPIIRQVLIAAGLLILLTLGLTYVYDGRFLFLTGMIGAGLVFAGITGICPMASLLARMPWNRAPSCRPADCQVG